MNKSQKPHVKWEKPDTKDIYYTIPFIRNF